METKEELINKATEIVNGSPLSDSEKQAWIDRFPTVSEKTMTLFVDTFGDAPDLLRQTSYLLQKKIDAGTTTEKLREVVKEEEGLLSKELEAPVQKS